MRGVATKPESLICVTVDVEWAHEEVLADLVHLLDAHNVRATFFCTHPGIAVPGHERALHPNFRRGGDIIHDLRAKLGADFADLADTDLYAHVLEVTRTFCPEAKGVRAHSLRYDTELLSLYHRQKLEYDSSYAMLLVENLRPFWKEHDMVELPIYYMDHLDLVTPRTGHELVHLRLDEPGLKVLDFHPNIVFTNAPTSGFYESTKPFYRNVDRLRSARHAGRGVRTLFLEFLEHLASRQLATATLGEVNNEWRSTR